MLNTFYKSLFNATPPSNSAGVKILLAFFIIFLVGGLALGYLLNKKAKHIPIYQDLSNRVYVFSSTCALIGLVLLFFRWQELPYISAPILLLVLIIVLLVWLGSIIGFYERNFKDKLEEFYKKQQLNKYLPKSKERKN